MVVEEFYLDAADGQNLYGKCWIPEDEIRYVILVLHDISDHTGRFSSLSEYFCEHQIAVLGLDQHGHGRSNGKRGHIRSFELILSNIQELAIEARRRFNDPPLFIFGQGMGGNMAINYILKQTSKEFSGIILSAPWFESKISLRGFRKAFFNVMSMISPSYTFATGIDPMDLTHDPETGLDYLEDQLNHGLISIKLFNELNKGASGVFNKIHDLNYPLLLMHGDEDLICKPDMTKQLAERANGLAELKIWEGMRHELHHEKNNKEVFRFMLDWINKKDPR